LNTLVTTATVQLVEAFVTRSGGLPVDHMPAGTPTLTINTSAAGRQGLGVLDPRINWRPADWVVEITVAKTTLGKANMPFLFPFPKERVRMFARTTATPGGGTIANAAELGFLLYDKDQPYHTIKIFDYDFGDGTYPMHPVLDYFGTSVQTNSMRRGLVNINSQDTNALASVFVNTPIQYYPGGPSVGTVSAADAQLIAAQLVTLTGANGTNSLSIVGRAVGLSGVVANLSDDCARESIVANSYRLLNPRENLFTVLLAAQVTAGSGVLAEQRAVAVVWRDPYPDTNNGGRHPMLVRFFKWLTDY